MEMAMGLANWLGMAASTEERTSCDTQHRAQLDSSLAEDTAEQAPSTQTHSVEVRWALSHDWIATIEVSSGSQLNLLKEQVSKLTKTPAQYLVLLSEHSPLEVHSLEDVGLSCILVARRCPEENALLEHLKAKVEVGLMNNFFSWPGESQEDIELVEFMLEHDIGLNNKDDRWRYKEDDPCFFNCTVLHYAALCGFSVICRLLLDSPKFKEVNATAEVAFYGKTFRGITMKSTQVGCTALQCAVAGAHFQICSILNAHPRFTQGNAPTAPNCAPVHLNGPFRGFQARDGIQGRVVDVAARA
jgi:hypothetical protein